MTTTHINHACNILCKIAQTMWQTVFIPSEQKHAEKRCFCQFTHGQLTEVSVSLPSIMSVSLHTVLVMFNTRDTLTLNQSLVTALWQPSALAPPVCGILVPTLKGHQNLAPETCGTMEAEAEPGINRSVTGVSVLTAGSIRIKNRDYTG